MSRDGELRTCVIIGGGPAGTGPLVFAASAGRLEEAVDRGVTVVEIGDRLCQGSIGKYVVNSNTPGALFVDCLKDERCKTSLPRSWATPARTVFEAAGNNPVPLREVGELLEALGRDIESTFRERTRGEVLLGHRAEGVTVLDNGSLEVRVRPLGRDRANIRKIRAKNVLVATGATPHVPADLRDRLVRHGKSPAAPTAMSMSADEFLTEKGFARAIDRLKRARAPRIVIVGGRSGAFSCAWLLLNHRETQCLGEASVWVLHRSPVKVQYDSIQEALDDGFADFGEADVCTQSGKVFRIGGIRGDSKALYRASRNSSDIGTRLRLRSLADGMQDRDGDLRWADVELVVFATGYTTREVPFFTERHEPIPLLGSRTGLYVDASASLLAANGARVPGAYSIGLGSGYLPQDGGFGGEKSFRSRDNSIFLCQRELGERLLGAILG